MGCSVRSGEVVLGCKMFLCLINRLKGPRTPFLERLSVYGIIQDIKFRHWAHMPSVGDGVCIVRMVHRNAIPHHMSIREVNVKLPMLASNRSVTCVTLLVILRGFALTVINASNVGLRVTYCGIALNVTVIVTVIQSQTPPLLKLLPLPLLLLLQLIPLTFHSVMTTILWMGCL